MKLLLVLFIAVTILLSSTEFEKTYLVYKSGDFGSSFESFKTLAEDDDLDAAYILAYMYEYGEGCDVDKAKAAAWYKISSKGYYYRGKYDSARDIDKEKRKLYESLEKSDDIDTDNTIRRHTQSLYNIKAHNPTYFLPISYRSNGHYPPTNEHDAKDMETEFQVSIKYDFTANLFDLDEVYTFAYTQLSFWQLYEESAYFRETNYNPEFFVTFPVSEINDTNFIKALRVSFAHQSNGRGGAEERSWNYLSVATYFQYKFLFTELKLWHRLSDKTDYNPNLIDTMGHGHIKFMLPYKKHLATVLLRNNFKGKGAIDASYSYPLFDESLFLYVKWFSGYGESLISYAGVDPASEDDYVDKIGIGFSISR